MRPTTALLISVMVVGSAAFSVVAADQPSGVTLTTSAEQLTISNVTKGGRVILAGVSITSERTTRRLRRFAQMLSDADGDGRIQFAPPGSVPLRSVWAVTDLESGATATAPGPGRSVTYLMQIPATAFKKDVDGAITGFESGGVEVELVVVRPRQGAWVTYAQEGFEGDEDGSRNGVIRAALSASVPIAPEFGSSPLKTKKDDVLILLDLRHLLVGTTVVTN